MAKKDCSVDGCERSHKAHGFCHLHYRRKLYGREVQAKIRRQHGKPGPQYCAYCWKVFTRPKARVGARDTGRFCSKPCAAQHKGRIVTEGYALRCIAKAWATPSKVVHPRVQREVAALHRISKYVERPARRVYVCRGCGVACTEVNRKHAKASLCGPCVELGRTVSRRKARQSEAHKASKRIYKARRRVREGVRADSIDPIKVFERDGWKCQICGVDTPRSLRGSYEDSAPELDHIKPLALDGEHTWLNVQCSCRKCNIRKGATYAGGVFRMVG